MVGAGLIGQLCARVLMHRGHQVTVFDRNPQRLECSAKAGLETEESLAQLDTFDAVVEATGAQEALRAVLHDSAASATILLLGMSYGASTFDFEQVVGYDKTIVGSVGSGHDDFEQAIELLQHIDTSTLIEKVLPMSEYQQAWQMARSGEALKVVLRVDSSLDARVLSGDWARKAWR